MRDSISKSFFIIINLFCILTLIFNSLFIYPSADDFSYYIGVNEKGWWEFQKWHYLNWGGRYIPNALLGSFSFEGFGMWLYRVLPIIFILGLFFSIMLFVKNVFKIDKKNDILTITSILFLGYTLSLYSISQQFYWLPGSLTYTFSTIICLLVWSFLGKMNSFSVFIPVLLGVFIINGTNEISVLMFNFSMVLFTAFKFFKNEKINSFQYSLLFLSIIFAGICLLAPGNSVRAEYIVSENTKSLIYSIPRTINRSGILIFEHFYTIIIVCIALLPFINKFPLLKVNISFLPQNLLKLIFMLFPFVILFLGVFPSYWATGRIPPQRTVNVVSFFFMISMIASMILYHSNFGLNHIIAYFKNKYIGIGLILVALLIAPNYLKNTILDLFSGKSYQYSQQMKNRINFIKKSPEKDIEIDPIEIPSIVSNELEEDKNHFYNVSYAKYYKKNSIVLKKK